MDKPFPYYYFLAGLVRSQGLSKIFEIGTYYGGSILSILQGIREENLAESRILTIDLSQKNKRILRGFPHIKRIQGDVISKKTTKKVNLFFPCNIDLLYIDSLHKYDHTKLCISIYANMLKPKYVVLDDIILNNSMRRLWEEIAQEFGDNALNISQICEKKGGFGIINWNHASYPNWDYDENSLQSKHIKNIYNYLVFNFKYMIHKMKNWR
jgi:cephalosporin hydroxylase